MRTANKGLVRVAIIEFPGKPTVRIFKIIHVDAIPLYPIVIPRRNKVRVVIGQGGWVGCGRPTRHAEFNLAI